MSKSEWAARADDFLARLGGRLDRMRDMLPSDSAADGFPPLPPLAGLWQSELFIEICARHGIDGRMVISIEGRCDGPNAWRALLDEVVECGKVSHELDGPDALEIIKMLSAAQAQGVKMESTTERVFEVKQGADIVRLLWDHADAVLRIQPGTAIRWPEGAIEHAPCIGVKGSLVRIRDRKVVEWCDL